MSHMRFDPGECMRRLPLHVLPGGFHRVRYYSLFANGHRAEKLALCRRLLAVPGDALRDEESTSEATDTDNPRPARVAVVV